MRQELCLCQLVAGIIVLINQVVEFLLPQYADLEFERHSAISRQVLPIIELVGCCAVFMDFILIATSTYARVYIGDALALTKLLLLTRFYKFLRLRFRGNALSISLFYCLLL